MILCYVGIDFSPQLPDFTLPNAALKDFQQAQEKNNVIKMMHSLLNFILFYYLNFLKIN